ncbi:hypothetical protein EZV62_005905 [Acer yangbiense]|uniref:Uncharacterized protein n=1 Tax=Acer yangbiense TaxID=1000413 RepID=A0A5C7IP00_9ROSI|nr:hypothetical protein EZV62_005905 [Acer yangbiense]
MSRLTLLLPAKLFYCLTKLQHNSNPKMGFFLIISKESSESHLVAVLKKARVITLCISMRILFEASYGFENIRDTLKLDPWTASYGVPEAFPSPAAIEFQSHTLQDFSSFLGSSSPQQRVDFSLSQLYQSQPQYEELVFWERLLKQLPNNEASGSYHSHLPREYPKIIETRLQQTNMEALRRQHFPLPQLQLRIDEDLQLQLQAIMEASQRQHSQLSQQQQLWFNEPPLQENRHEVPPPGSDITLNTGMENKIVWNAISDVYRALQACSSPGADIHWPYGEIDKPLFDIPFFSGKIDSSGLPYNREMDQRLNITHQPMFRIPFYSGKIGSSSLPAPVIDLYLEPSAHDGKPRRRGPDKGKRKPRGPRKQ